jgi:hypothetical protein
MGFTLKFTETGSRGSFVSAGTGFHYHYNPDTLILDILDARSNRPLLFIDFDQYTAKDPRAYVESLEKTTQIKALMFSNNGTTDLSESFDDTLLFAILENCARIARYSFDLRTSRFHRFSHYFCKDQFIDRVQIKKITSRDPSASFYVAKLKTLTAKTVNTRACTIPTVMRNLSEQVIRELITAEFTHPFQNPAHNLLNLSSILSMLGRVLDDSFVPAQYLHKTTAQNTPLQRAQEDA